jgi:hypothetical protein
MWTGIALMAAVLTVAEVAAVASAARGAQRWWDGDQGRAVRRASAIVGGMIAERLGGRPVVCGGSWATGVSDLHRTLEVLAATGDCRGRCPAIVIRRAARGRLLDARERLRDAREARVLARERTREMVRTLERWAL